MSVDELFRYHMHSDLSLLDSCTDFKEYVDLVKADGGIAIASTEHGLPRGWIAKKLYCDKMGIQFVHGVEIYLTRTLDNKIRDNFHTVLLARNWDGVKELNALVSMSTDEKHTYYNNRISFEEFLGISDNIIKTSACIAGPLSRLQENDPWFEPLARHYDYLEIQPHVCEEQAEYNKKLARLSDKYGIPLSIGTDTHSSTAYKNECRDILMVFKGQHYADEDKFDLTYRSTDRIFDMFRRQDALPQDVVLSAAESTNAMVDRFEPFQLDRSIKYPVLNGSPEEDERQFTERVWVSLDEKLASGVIPKEEEAGFRSALEEELRVFSKLKMGGFMLSMSDLVRWCKENGMAIGTARGSVGGSRAAYVTDITDLDPEKWHTVFSRFCNEDRVEIGDIDVDVVYDDRPKIFQYIIDRFGARKTARVAAYGTLAEKSIIDGICKALLLKTNDEKYSIAGAKRIKAEFTSDPDKARADYPEVFRYYDGLASTKISQSVHPAGMVISPITLDDHYGVFLKDGEYCLMLDMDEAHEVGLAKYDFLALKTVKVIRDICTYIGKTYPRSCDIDWSDQDVWDDVDKNQATIFQFEGSFAAECFKRFQPRSIFDMSLVTACIRPSGASYRNDLLAKVPHHNPSKLIDDMLSENLGYLVYQEDVIKFLQDACGLSGSEADTIRRAIAKKKRDALDKAMPSIIDGYCSRSDKPMEEAKEEALEFLQVIEDASSYMFGYNHSVAYCLLGYLCAYYRHYYPVEYTTSYLNNAANDDDIKAGTALARRLGLRVTMPKWGVSRAEYYFNKERRMISKGLMSIKYMSSALVDELYPLYDKKYISFMDLLRDLDQETSMDSRQLDILIKLDFFSEFGNQRELLRIVDFFNKFKKGEAKQIKKSAVENTALDEIVSRHAVGVTKNGTPAKSYTLLDVMSILRDIEAYLKGLGMEDLGDVTKARNFKTIMGYPGYVSGRQEDRPKLYVVDLFPVCRKRDGKQFGYSVLTKSLGSGIDARFTVFDRVYDKDPIMKDDIIYCDRFEREGKYFTMTAYHKIYV